MVKADGLLKREGDKGEDRTDSKKYRNDGEKNSGSSERSANNLSNPESSFRKNKEFEDDCLDLLKILAQLTSKEAALKFQLYQLLEEAKVETIRLSGIISLYEMISKNDVKTFRSKLEELFSKYVRFSER
ncbi:MAG: hypothetical protein ACP5GU_09365 [Thermoprotei archaeon]